jgi:hypothetical protein
MTRKLVIKVNGFGEGTVELDGTDISSSVRAVEFRADAHLKTTVSLELSVSEIETTYLGSAESEILVNIPDDVITTLITLGWTPPEHDKRTYRMPVTTWVPADQLRGFEEPSPAEVVLRNERLRVGCLCFQLDHHEEYFENGTHHERCPLFITDNASPDAND